MISLFLSTIPVLPVMICLCVGALSFALELSGNNRFWRAFIFGGVFLNLLHFTIAKPLSSQAIELTTAAGTLPWRVFKLTGTGGIEFCFVSLTLLFLITLLAPKSPGVPTRPSRVFMIQALLFVAGMTNSSIVLLCSSATILLLAILAMKYQMAAHSDDNRAPIRFGVFKLYQGAAAVCFLLCASLRTLPLSEIASEYTALVVTVDTLLLLIGIALVTGFFPFHSWVVPFFGAPRETLYLPMFMIQLGLVLFFRLYVPLSVSLSNINYLLVTFSTFGLLYQALLLFSENRLKRIPGHLYLSHISLMTVSVTGLGMVGISASMLDGVNVLICVLGLMSVCAMITSRFGVQGASTPTGLASLFPELAVCYLLCVLSLVGFPGTLGFIEEEVLLGQGIEHHLVLIGVITLALTLNGFSAYRLFARVFYGQPIQSMDNDLGILPREKAAIILIIVIIITNGFFPEWLYNFSSLPR